MIDSHCHLFSNDYPDIDDVLEKMGENIVIVSGVDDNTNKEVVDLCCKYKNVYGTLGIHPEAVDDDYSLEFIEEHINDSKIIGIGEIGLDYYYRKDNKEKQKLLFCKQIEIAIKYNKPIVVHSREAINDTFMIIKKYEYGNNTLIHCFSSSLEMANKFIKLGCYLGFGGVLTFKNSIKLKDIILNIDINHVLLETDSPYLTPVPFRGKRNEPYNVLYVASEIARIREMEIDEVLKITKINTLKLFDIK